MNKKRTDSIRWPSISANFEKERETNDYSPVININKIIMYIGFLC